MTEKTISDIGEFGLIKLISHDLIYRPEFVKIGPGDDGAVYSVPDGFDQVISTDTMVEGIHFTSVTMSAYDVGWKLCASNFSDMAAMGADPIGFVISAAFPEKLYASWVEHCYEGIRDCCKEYRVNLLGGDMTGSVSDIIMTGTVVGIVPKDTAVRRSGARRGDVVFVTGHPGDSAGGLYALLHENKEYRGLIEKHKHPRPQIAWGTLLREAGASSLNDISDGISREINEIAEASGVSIKIDKSFIPVSAEALEYGRKSGIDPLSWALDGGEDYELIGTISREDFEKVKNRPGIKKIGVVTDKPGKGVFLEQEGHLELLEVHGYDHFGR